MNTAKEEISSIKLTELFINQTNRTIFLTGKAGTGKTTLLRKIVQSTQKNTVIVAPTGIAALNAGGVTIHSFFQLPFGAFIPDNQSPNVGSYVKHENKTTLKRHFKMNKRRISIIRNLELLKSLVIYVVLNFYSHFSIQKASHNFVQLFIPCEFPHLIDVLKHL